jgi:hypothetical protein
MSDAEIAIEPVRGHPNAFHFRFATHDGEITGRVSVAIEGKPETRSSEEKLRAAKIKVEHLVNAAPKPSLRNAMPTGPEGPKRPPTSIGRAVPVMRIATGEEAQHTTLSGFASRRRSP